MPWPKTSRQSRGYGRAWELVRASALSRDSFLCVPCYRKGHITLAAAVDHIVPKQKGGTDNLTNLQSICDPCHKAKTDREIGREIKQRIGLDGWPIDDAAGQGG